MTIPGFYDAVQELSAAERKALAEAPFDEKEYMRELGVDAVRGEKGYSSEERSSIRPTLDVNGIWGGYIGEGAKTVLPSKAFAKLSMRLVPNQKSADITKLFQDHFVKIAPPGVKVVVRPHHGGEAAVTPIDSPAYLAASKAMEETFGKKPIPPVVVAASPSWHSSKKELGLEDRALRLRLGQRQHPQPEREVRRVQLLPRYPHHSAFLPPFRSFGQVSVPMSRGKGKCRWQGQ